MITMCLEKLLEIDYVLLDFEAQIIVPYILEKSGHAKDRIAKLYGAIMVHLANCCSTNKYAAYVVKALESKNTRTQTSCLTELARLIDLTGLVKLQYLLVKLYGTLQIQELESPQH